MGHRILIVDDEPDLRSLVKGYLERQGFLVQEAATGIAALKVVREHPPDLILLDVMMPEMDGNELARRLRADPVTAPIPIVMLTIRGHTFDRAGGLAAGAEDYITKPFDPADLARRITAILNPGRGEPVGGLLREIAHGALIVLGADVVWLLAADPATRTLRSAAIAGLTGEETARVLMRGVKGGPGEVSFPLSPQINPLCDAVLSGATWVERPISEIAAAPGGELLARGLEGIHGRVASIVPLTVGGQHVGAMLTARQGDTRPGTDDPQVIGMVANQAAMAIQNARLMEEIEQREAEARSASQFHQTLINTMGDGLALLDDRGRIKFANRRLVRMLGYSEKDLLGRDLVSLLQAEDQPSVISLLRQTGGATTSFEKRILRADGSFLAGLLVLVPPAQNGAGIGSVVVLGDLTEQKAREAALVRRGRQLGAINHASRAMASSLELDAVLQTILKESAEVLGASGGSILLLEPSSGDLVFQVTTGKEAGRLTGVHVPAGQGLVGWVAEHGRPALVPDAHRDDRFYPGIDDQTGLTTTSVLAVPLLVNRKAIGALELLNKAEGPFDSEDQGVLESLAQSAAAAIDNARLYLNLRRHSEELQKAYAELKEADRLKEEMIQNVSHELWTPLTVVLGYVVMMTKNEFGPLTEQQRECMEIVLRKTRALSRVVKDTVTLVRMKSTALDRRWVDLIPLLEQAVKSFSMMGRETGHRIELEAAPDLPEVEADEERLSQVVDNLLDNAVKFSPEGGRVVVQVEDTGPVLRVGITDNGIGIPKAELSRIFERFYQVDGSLTRRYSGVGLGLAICKEIVEAHGGQIWAESEPGKGSTFYFSLPKQPG